MLTRFRPGHVNRWVLRPFLDRIRDSIHGIETRRPVRHPELGFDATMGVDYVPSDWRVLRKVLLPSDVRPGDVFLDVGAGKGLVLHLASSYGFARLIGVEVSEALCQTARANLASVTRRLPNLPMEVVHSDAKEYVMPDDVTHIYMYNPFHADVMSAFLTNLMESVARRPRSVLLIYNNPVLDLLVRDFGFIPIRDRDFLAVPRHHVTVYRYRPNAQKA